MIEISKEEYEKLKEIERRFIKGEIIERKLAYYTCREQLLYELKLEWDIFIKRLKDTDRYEG